MTYEAEAVLDTIDIDYVYPSSIPGKLTNKNKCKPHGIYWMKCLKCHKAWNREARFERDFMEPLKSIGSSLSSIGHYLKNIKRNITGEV